VERAFGRTRNRSPGGAAAGELPRHTAGVPGVTAAVIGFVVALVTSLGVSIACVAYLR
jgi:hypothetical protein